MAEELQQIRTFLERLRSRQRRLLVLSSLFRGLGALCVMMLLLAIAASTGGSRTLVLTVATLGSLVAFGFVVAPFRLWSHSSDLIGQARRVERLVPELRSRLLTAIDFSLRGELPRTSNALFALAVRKAQQKTQQIPLAAVHSSRSTRRAAASLCAAGVVLAIGGALLPVGPLQALDLLRQDPIESSVTAEQARNADEETALIGDITLRYSFPDYTGLEPIEVPNSDGTIHAPPGTMVQIRARTAEEVDAVALQVDQLPPVPATLEGGRSIRTSLTVEQSGTWRVILTRGDEVVRSADYVISVDEDAPPVVTAEQGSQRRIPINRPLNIGWTAQDDFGLKRVMIEIEQDGNVQEFELRTPLNETTELSGNIRLSPRELGLQSGQTARLRVVAEDNDWVAGGKQGASFEMEIEVLGPLGHGRQLVRYHRALRDVMVVVLADFLEESVPPSSSRIGMMGWVESSRSRFEPIEEIMEDQWGDETPSSVDGEQVQNVMEAAARLFRFTVTAYDPATGRQTTEGDLETFSTLHAEQIESLEQAIYILDLMLRQVALSEVAQKAQNVSDEAQELLEFSQGDPEASELLARLDQLERMLADLSRSAQMLSEGQLKEFVNARTDEAMNLMSEIRKAISEGRIEDAQQMMERLAEQLQQMSEGLNEQMQQSQDGDSELSEAFEKMMEELEQLEQSQEELADQLSEAREQENEQGNQQVALWEEVLELAERVENRAGQAVDATGDGQGWWTRSVARLTQFHDQTALLLDAVRARDLDASLGQAMESLRQHNSAVRTVENERVRARGDEPIPSGINEAASGIADAGVALEQLLDKLEQLQESSQEESQRMQELAQQMAQQQQQLQERQQQLEQQITQIERAMPTADGSAGESMEQAGESMERAREQLSGGRSVPGEGHQRDAARRLGTARDSLQQQMDQYQQMQQQMRQMQGQGGQGSGQSGENSDGEDGMTERSVDIPSPERFQTPEEYRRALLEGMEADVPEEYEALKKRYYEDLVRQ